MERSEKQPLAGIRVLVTRAVEQSAELVEDLTSKGASVTVIPALLVEALPEPEGFARAMERVGSYEKVIVTSVNGVRFARDLLRGKGITPRDLPPALCVGEKTASAWGEVGGTVAATPEDYTAVALLDLLGKDLTGSSFLILRPEVVKTEVAEELKRRGAEVDEFVIYRTTVPAEGAERLVELLREDKPDVVLFASPSAIDGILSMAVQSSSSYANDCRTVSEDGESRVQSENNTQNPELRTQNSDRGILDIPAICIGPTTAKAAEEAGFTEVYFPDHHTSEGMVEELMVIAGGLK